MDLQLKDRFYIVTAAGTGFGRAIAERLLAEGAQVLAVARTEAVLEAFRSEAGNNLEILAEDITHSSTIDKLIAVTANRRISGLLVNAGGPPAKAFMETSLDDWDEAYRAIVRWKVEITQKFLPVFQAQQYGRLVFVESVSVKQPVENLVLSNSLRAAVTGFVKTASQEMAATGITMNILSPGYHDTAAMQRLFVKKAAVENISEEQARQVFESSIPVKRMGKAEEMAVLASWLLSPLSGFVTGQSFSHDGGLVKGLFG
ncbi:MAG: SDR family oxidoreductase [Bacteroidetes bacterium]|nr:SDR family oxidoreductase [Bacteroidota bacterium]MBU1580278.1 SDR family oxidoreductase [Bacteroidota bacterium]MBU2464771.1 SDR family oxidoreductase [Bacteroidota bacterium]MBU2556562.1 SDR family oxidoreductase [Bacteroidota bacterium]